MEACAAWAGLPVSLPIAPLPPPLTARSIFPTFTQHFLQVGSVCVDMGKMKGCEAYNALCKVSPGHRCRRVWAPKGGVSTDGHLCKKAPIFSYVGRHPQVCWGGVLRILPPLDGAHAVQQAPVRAPAPAAAASIS